MKKLYVVFWKENDSKLFRCGMLEFRSINVMREYVSILMNDFDNKYGCEGGFLLVDLGDKWFKMVNNKWEEIREKWIFDKWIKDWEESEQLRIKFE